MKAIVVGAGGVARALLRRMAPMWQVTLVDLDQARLAAAAQVRPAEVVVGDGSSLVVLRRAGIAEADALVAATGDDDVNLEVCRLARREGLVRVVAVAADSRRRGEYQSLGVPAFQPHTLAARQLELHLEPRRVSSTAFAHGRAEALEVQVAGDSPVRGRALRELASGTWLVAALLRGDRLVVPHGNTVLETGDIVTVVGEAGDLPTVLELFTQGEAHFPLDYGQRVAVAVDGAADGETLLEAARLAHDSSAAELLVVRRQPGSGEEQRRRETDDALAGLEACPGEIDLRIVEVASPPAAALPQICTEQSVGVVVVPAPRRGRLGALRAGAALRRAHRLRRPVLFSRGSTAARGVVVPVGNGAADAAFRAAVDLAHYAGVPLTAVAVLAPSFLSGGEATEHSLAEGLEELRAEAAAQAVTVEVRVCRGNPVREVGAVAAGAGLLVVAAPAAAPSALRPGVAGHLVARAAPSVLVVPGAPSSARPAR